MSSKFVAVVTAKGRASYRPLGDWACFLGPSKHLAVAQAVNAIKQWRGGQNSYDIVVGQVTEKVVFFTYHELQPL